MLSDATKQDIREYARRNKKPEAVRILLRYILPSDPASGKRRLAEFIHALREEGEGIIKCEALRRHLPK